MTTSDSELDPATGAVLLKNIEQLRRDLKAERARRRADRIVGLGALLFVAAVTVLAVIAFFSHRDAIDRIQNEGCARGAAVSAVINEDIATLDNARRRTLAGPGTDDQKRAAVEFFDERIAGYNAARPPVCEAP